MALFTPQTAREMHRRSREAIARAKILLDLPPAGPPQPASPISNEVTGSTRAQIAAIDRRLANADRLDPETLDLLTRSKERLWKILAHAAGIAAPANFKPSRKDRSSAIVDLEPVPLPSLTDTPIEQAPGSSSPGSDLP